MAAGRSRSVASGAWPFSHLSGALNRRRPPKQAPSRSRATSVGTAGQARSAGQLRATSGPLVPPADISGPGCASQVQAPPAREQQLAARGHQTRIACERRRATVATPRSPPRVRWRRRHTPLPRRSRREPPCPAPWWRHLSTSPPTFVRSSDVGSSWSLSCGHSPAPGSRHAGRRTPEVHHSVFQSRFQIPLPK